MRSSTAQSKRLESVLLGAIVVLFALISAVGIMWGLPSRKIDKYLFGDDPPWSGEKIYRLAGAAEKFAPDRGADVDVDPLEKARNEPMSLTATDQEVAKIYLRYRLYTYQPDEMITMMALAGMNPRTLHLDPRLYQYGGLFIYPVGALIGVCGLAGLIDLRSDVTYYLDNPDEFGKFYVVARAYSAAWGIVGALCVFAIGRRLGGARAGLPAALLFILMPVVICMAHEGKPHLPGAALMLLAVLLAMRYLGEGLARGTRRDWWLMCVCCGAAFAMVLSSWPILVLIPLIALRAASLGSRGEAGGANGRPPNGPQAATRALSVRALPVALKRTGAGLAVAAGVYLIANPYIVINAFVNRDVLRSNFGNSLAMYEIARVGEGFIRVVELSIEGAALPVVILGVIAIVVALVRKNASIIPLAAPALLFFLQFVLIGAGKPAEYGRFGIFPNTALAIGASCLLAQRWTRFPRAVDCMAATLVVIWTGFCGAEYLCNFRIDTTTHNSRLRIAEEACERSDGDRTGNSPKEPGQPLSGVIVLAEPAPYSCPPLPFARLSVYLFSDTKRAREFHRSHRQETLFVHALDRGPRQTRTIPQSHGIRMTALAALLVNPAAPHEPPQTPISWANKPFYADGQEVWDVFDGPPDRP
jgi:hypothetical protein